MLIKVNVKVKVKVEGLTVHRVYDTIRYVVSVEIGRCLPNTFPLTL